MKLSRVVSALIRRPRVRGSSKELNAVRITEWTSVLKWMSGAGRVETKFNVFAFSRKLSLKSFSHFCEICLRKWSKFSRKSGKTCQQHVKTKWPFSENILMTWDIGRFSQKYLFSRKVSQKYVLDRSTCARQLKKLAYFAKNGKNLVIFEEVKTCGRFSKKISISRKRKGHFHFYPIGACVNEQKSHRDYQDLNTFRQKYFR